MLKFLYLSMIIFFISGMALAKSEKNLVTTNSDSVGLYEKFEVTFDFAASFFNPYNYDEIKVTAVFTSPSSKNYEVDGFYYQDFDIYGC